MKKILCVVGTRPEAIKMAPVILALKQQPWVKVKVLATAQHRHMLDQVLDVFNIEPDIDLNIMRPNQSLTTLTARLLLDLDDVLQAEQPDAVLVQGDTTTVMTVTLACFYQKIPVGHIEAGLRTGDIYNPFPEEANRAIAARLAKWHFAPTQSSANNLLAENIDNKDILVTGNTVIDALLMTADNAQLKLDMDIAPEQKLVLITCHRRENFGTPFNNICNALATLAQNNPQIQFLYPVHPNPNVKDTAHKILATHANIHLCEPLDYAPFVAAMKRAYFIITDSGGVQEEAPALGKPVLVLRNETERPEAIDANVVKLVGTDYENILAHAQSLMDDKDLYQSMAQGVSPYGDGKAAARIIQHLQQHCA